MKRMFAAVLAFVSLALLQTTTFALNAPTGHAVATASHASDPQADPATITVYVTKTGAKYHRDGCRYLSRSKIAMSLKDAAKRFGPCSVCKPPTVK